MDSESFPDRFEHADPSRIVTETFGGQLGTWGALLAAFGALSLPEPGGTGQRAVLALIGAAGAGLIGWEMRRRSRPTRLCPGRDAVGVYRAGTLSGVVPRGEVVSYLLEWTNTVKILFVLGMCSAATAALAWAALTMAEDAWSLVMGPAAFLAFGSAFASSWRTRLRCEHFLIPRPNGRNEWVMLSREDARRLREGA
ncbi:MAG: hypothetical protein HY928_14610 [Elusimicrobia bacterium]|nr:hypothetical protein [Elusimicrobiota bacterium]